MGENVGETDVPVNATVKKLETGESESNDGGDNKRFNENSDNGSHKKPRTEKQIAAAKKLVELQKERLARGEPAGRRKGAIGKKTAEKIQDSGSEYLNKRYDTELLYEFDRLRRDEDKKKRLGEALNHHFSAFKDELRTEIRDEMNNNIQRAFEGPLNNFFKIEDEEEESPVEEREEESIAQKPKEVVKDATRFQSFFPVHSSKSREAGESAQSQGNYRRSFWN